VLPSLSPIASTLPSGLNAAEADATARDLALDPELIAEIQLAVDDADKAVSRAESIRRFRILGTDFTEASGQLTPTLKLRRNVIAREFAADIEALYSPAS
jgi:long-chain acyl-CoA synthetase